MRLHYVLLVALTTLLASSKFVAADFQHTPLAKMVASQQDYIAKRSLRIHKQADDSDEDVIEDNKDEERGLNLLDKAKIQAWIVQGKTLSRCSRVLD
ncbi:unnamed protein product [Phytophthora lilii]|uniref:RxLR effector protein n=1 Tax=Phytophthora lilii TaxID=2077276 RepID=A0A9W6U2M3_9STRA|nr:unnamed protein product [Phytophthora lilii]